MIDLLNNSDLFYIAKKLNITLNENITYKNLYTRIKPKTGNYIFNMQSASNTSEGTHWCAFIIKPTIAIYFDSFGMSVPSDIVNFIRRYDNKIKILFSNDNIQHIDSVLCGYFCIFFIYFVSILHKNSTNYRRIINLHNHIFSKDEKQNDKILQQLFSNIFKSKIL